MAVKAGYIYILKHPSDETLIKVGMTTRNVEQRIKEHNTQFDKAAGLIVKNTGQEWVLYDSIQVEDTYNAESAFWQRSPWTEIPFRGKQELIKLSGALDWSWVQDGIEAAKSAGVRDDISKPPIPKDAPKTGSQSYHNQLLETGLSPVKGYGNGIAKVWFSCANSHVFKLDSKTLCRFLACPLCEPSKFDDYTLNRVEYE
jgi:predicted GIY-YIG superfamily endonuclease